MKRKIINWQQVKKERARLLAAGFRIVEKSEYHWHVIKEPHTSIVNVWPTARKYMKAGSSSAQYYNDVVKEVAAIFSEMEKVTGFKEKVDVDEMHSQGLDYFKKKI